MGRALARVDRPEAIVSVAGDFKQGKSSLVNALLGADLCPVDDGLATTAITVVRDAGEPQVLVHVRVDGRSGVEQSSIADLRSWATEAGGDAARSVERVEVEVPNPLLARGIVVIDTPGEGGLAHGDPAATLAALSVADAVLVVTDAAAGLSQPELESLAGAREQCPVVVTVLTKVDLFPDWRRIAEIDTRLLADLGLGAPFPVSAALRREALRRRDAQLNVESGIPALLAAVTRDVVAPRRATAIRSARAEARRALADLRAPIEAELGVHEQAADPATAERLAAVRARVAQLRGPGARWAVRLNDGFAELATEVDHTFRAGLRRLQRDFDDEVERIDPAADWDAYGGRLQREAGEAVRDAYGRLIVGVERIEASVVDLLAGEPLDLPALPGLTPPEVRAPWSAPRSSASPVRSGASATWGALRGAQGGVLTLGLVGSVAGLTVAGPVLIGAAAVFGARQIAEDRRKRLAERRQEARTAARQFLDDVQFDVGARFRDLIRDIHQRLRDHFAERLDTLQRTYTETTRGLEDALRHDQQARVQRAAELRQRLDRLDRLAMELDDGES